MKLIILAAGYATRLYPLTENFPKPLLEIQGKTILDHMLDKLSDEMLEEIIVVTNHRFVNQFEAWKKQHRLQKKMSILDDGSTDNDNRLGAVKDIVFALEQEKITDDVMVVAGDNLLDFSLDSLIQYYKEKDATVIMRHFEEKKEKLQRTGVAQIDKDDLVLEMEEKPKKPKSNWAIPPFYIFKAKDLQLLKEALESGCASDAPGDFISWLCSQTKVYAMEMPGTRMDIGTLESYEKAKESV